MFTELGKPGKIIKLLVRPLSERQSTGMKLQINLKIVSSRGGEGATVSKLEINYLLFISNNASLYLTNEYNVLSD
ncbi:hypothetical protein KKE34_04055 [Patescibacteria group bacterium]|nr:hypothetical protein [Patescibacteria group bacterium]MBU1885754.1 hypothetical protein [Patescibacteria group bacterium]